MANSVHKSVLAAETVDALSPRDGGLYVDATFGAGGISRALLESSDCSVLAIDRDPEAIERSAPMRRDFAGRFEILEGRFGSMDVLLKPALERKGRRDVDGVTFDLGVSSPQLDEAERGFSFQSDGPLDMRMGRDGPTAADIVNTAEERELESLIREYGEERQARRIAHAIVEARENKRITRTIELANLVASVARGKPGERIHPATRTFQALRIALNDELKELALGLSAAERLLKEAGRLAVVSFHSLEDRIVKLFLTERSKPAPARSRHLPPAAEAARSQSFRVLTKRPIMASAAETHSNPRARSAKLRVAERTNEPSLPLDLARLGIVEKAR